MLYRLPVPKPYIHQGPTIQQTDPIPKTGQPSLSATEARLHSLKPMMVVPPQLHQGPTIQQEVPPLFMQPLIRQVQTQQPILAFPQVPLVAVVADLVPTLPAQPLFRLVVQPVLKPQLDDLFLVDTIDVGTEYPNPAPPRRILHLLTGPTPQLNDQALGVFFPSPKPQQNQILRFQSVGPTSQFDGPTIQDTFLFSIAQPPLRREIVRPTGPSPQLDQVAGASVQTDTFTLSQPVRVPQPLRTSGSIPQLDQVTVTQTDIFTLAQPNLAYQLLLNAAIARTAPSPQLLDLYLTFADTYLFPVSQPDLRAQPLRFAFIPRTGSDPNAATSGSTCVCPPSTGGFVIIVND